jgi:hypothetical protein
MSANHSLAAHQCPCVMRFSENISYHGLLASTLSYLLQSITTGTLLKKSSPFSICYFLLFTSTLKMSCFFWWKWPGRCLVNWAVHLRSESTKHDRIDAWWESKWVMEPRGIGGGWTFFCTLHLLAQVLFLVGCQNREILCPKRSEALVLRHQWIFIWYGDKFREGGLCILSH